MTARISDEEKNEFREAMRGAVMRAPSDRLPQARPLPAPDPRQTRADEAAVLEEMMRDPEPEAYESGDTLSWARPGVQHGVMRRLRRGHYRVEAELDLHGLNSQSAALEVQRFLAGCRDLGRSCVRIIHGKGLRSPNSGPVLKVKLAHWLRKRDDVLAYVSARPMDGGTGAVYVLLRRR